MKRNMGKADGTARMLVAALLVVLSYTHVLTGMAAIIAMVVSAVFLLTSLVGFCPLYMLFGIHTNKTAKTR